MMGKKFELSKDQEERLVNDIKSFDIVKLKGLMDKACKLEIPDEICALMIKGFKERLGTLYMSLAEAELIDEWIKFLQAKNFNSVKNEREELVMAIIDSNFKPLEMMLKGVIADIEEEGIYEYTKHSLLQGLEHRIAEGNDSEEERRLLKEYCYKIDMCKGIPE